jgi:RimJ/RimL family protein N-acetyltransferase
MTAIGTPLLEDLPTLRTARLVLRGFRTTDAPTVQAALSDRAIAEGTLRVPHPYPDGAAAEWIAGLAAKWESGRFVSWAVTDTESDTVIGAMSFRLDPANRRGEVGYWIARPRWGAGVATEALRAVVACGFDQLALHRIEGHHFSENSASGRVMQRVGMRHEGRVRGAVWRDGVPRDLELYGMLRSDPRG